MCSSKVTADCAVFSKSASVSRCTAWLVTVTSRSVAERRVEAGDGDVGVDLGALARQRSVLAHDDVGRCILGRRQGNRRRERHEHHERGGGDGDDPGDGAAQGARGNAGGHGGSSLREIAGAMARRDSVPAYDTRSRAS